MHKQFLNGLERYIPDSVSGCANAELCHSDEVYCEIRSGAVRLHPSAVPASSSPSPEIPFVLTFSAFRA